MYSDLLRSMDSTFHLFQELCRRLAPPNIAWAVGSVLDVDHNKPGDGVMSRGISIPGGLDYIFGRMHFLKSVTGRDIFPPPTSR